MKSPEILSLVHRLLLLLGGSLWLLVPARADLNSDLAFTSFSNVDLNALDGGQVLQARGGLIPFQRGITSQSLYLINAVPAEVSTKLVSWNPASHPELKVWMHQALPPKPALSDFSGLGTLPDNSSVSFLINATAKLDPANPSLQLDQNEAQLITSLRSGGSDDKTLFVNFWSQVLLGRINNFFNAKLGTANYAISGGDIQPLNEIKSLLRSDSKIYAHYHTLLSQTPVYNSTKATPSNLYYESFDVEGGASLGTGAIYQLPQPTALSAAAAGQPPIAPADASAPPAATAGPIQSADIEYYLNYGIYTSLELEEMWPVTVNGKNETLVWRDDLVSTANVAYLHGTERLASGMIMLQDVKQAITAFRSEFK